MRFTKLSLLTLLTIPACVDSQQPTEAADVTAALEQDNGGFTTTDEAPAFGSDDLFAAASIEADAATVDPMASDTDIIAMNTSAAVEAHELLVMWGRMPSDPDALTGRDWSGQLKLSRGALLVRRTVAFEDRTDAVLPRATRDAVEFRSVTRPFSDGLVLTVLDPTPGDASPLTLTYTSADATTSYALDLSQLATGPIVIDAGDGNKIVAAGHRRDDSCRHGHMRGRWHALSAHAGAFLGVVANAGGDPVGHVRGIYGERRNGDTVVFGKFIDRDGKFTGIIHGEYHDGRFEARWLDRAGDHGVIQGATFEGATVRAGAFVARWAETSCGN